MTYCLAMCLDQGLVFASDSRTNAGPDQVNTFRKMHLLLADAEHCLVLLSAGNLATTQGVRSRIARDLELAASTSLKTVQSMNEAAEYVGAISVDQRRKHADGAETEASLHATFILGGQIKERAPGIFLIYPEGNFIRASRLTPYLQIGELKYGKPILDRLASTALSLEDAARCALLSMDATMRSNVSVGPPIEVLTYQAATKRRLHRVFEDGDEYIRQLRASWQSSLETAFRALPPLPAQPTQLRAVDE